VLTDAGSTLKLLTDKSGGLAALAGKVPAKFKSRAMNGTDRRLAQKTKPFMRIAKSPLPKNVPAAQADGTLR
jgi:hypothetical protein